MESFRFHDLGLLHVRMLVPYRVKHRVRIRTIYSALSYKGVCGCAAMALWIEQPKCVKSGPLPDDMPYGKKKEGWLSKRGKAIEPFQPKVPRPPPRQTVKSHLNTMPPMTLKGIVTKVGVMRKTATVTVSRWVIHKQTGKVRTALYPASVTS